jgi:hypothetical protein
MLSPIEGHFIRGFGVCPDDPEKQIELIHEAAEQAEAFLNRIPKRHSGLIGWAT